MRTAKEFVQQMFREKKAPPYIRAIAANSRWSSQIDEVDKWIAFGLKRKKTKKLKIRRKKS